MSAMPISGKRMLVRSLIVLMWSFCGSKYRKVVSKYKAVVGPGPPCYKCREYHSSHQECRSHGWELEAWKE